jgi:thioester reductase-like protein
MAHYFFTGFPGFICTALIKELLRETEEVETVYVLVLPQFAQKANEEIGKIAHDAKRPRDHFTVITGDITQPNLGIAPEYQEELQDKVNYIFHLAAIYDLAVPYDLAYNVNVNGTKNVNDWVMTLKNLKRYIYFSTAYISGTRVGRIYETEFDMGQSFKNHYESTKFEAEKWVRTLFDEVPLTIIRPGIVKGHSETGETIKFDGPYFMLNLLDRMRHFPIIPYFGESAAEGNFVPVDYVLKGTIYLAHAEKAVGKTYHLTDPKPYRMRDVYRMMMEAYLHKKPVGTMPLSFARGLLSIPSVRKWLRVEKEALDYLTCQAEYDASIAQQDLAEAGIVCPDFADTLASMIAFYDAHKNDPDKQLSIT